MLHLLKIDLKKMTSYRTFWVFCGLYFVILAFATASGMEVLKWIASLIDDFGKEININRIPLYHFPDVWLNLIWFAGWLKIIPAIMVVISVTNEYSYRTLRQNIIDGLSRSQFLMSKMLSNLLLSLLSVVLVFLIGLITGMIYSPYLHIADMVTDLEFFFAYFLEIFFFMSYALMLGILIQRSGLTIMLVLFSQALELIITAKLDNSVPGVSQFFPMRSLWNLIEWPYPRYALREIRDYLTFGSVAIVIFWTAAFNLISYYKLKKADI